MFDLFHSKKLWFVPSKKHRETLLDLENDFKYLCLFCGCPRNPVHQTKSLDYWDIELADLFSDPLWVWLMVWHQFFEDLKKCSSSVDQQWLELVNLAPLSVYVEDLVWIIWRVRSKGVIQMDISIKGVAIHLVEIQGCVSECFSNLPSRELKSPTWRKGNHLQECLAMGYISSQEGSLQDDSWLSFPDTCVFLKLW